MEFCVISPTAGLERYSSLSRTHLVLNQVYRVDPPYAQYYRKHHLAGDFIILDNGAYEGFKDEDLAHTALELRPDVIVLPDFYLQRWEKTWHASIAWLDSINPSIQAGTEFCYIPQATEGDYEGFIHSYHCALDDDRITWIGIPRALATHIAHDPLARVNFARLVKRDKPDIHLHAFGMCNGDVHEIPYLAAAGIRSIDSSAPVWRGWHGVSLSTFIPEGFPPVDFNAKEDPQQESLIMSNLEACGVDTRRRSDT